MRKNHPTITRPEVREMMTFRTLGEWQVELDKLNGLEKEAQSKNLTAPAQTGAGLIGANSSGAWQRLFRGLRRMFSNA